MSEAYIVEYGDERGNQRQTTYTYDADGNGNPSGKALEDALSTLEALGTSRHGAFGSASVYGSTVESAAHNYVVAAIPWESVYNIGDGDNPFTIHGYDDERGVWSVSLIIVSEV